MKIILIEDEVHIANLIKFNLERRGKNVMIAPDAELGLKLIEEQKPDLILLDIMLPGMDGYAACSKIKNDPILKKTPVFMLTALTQSKDIEKAFECGADDYITKPFLINELWNTIDKKYKQFKASNSNS